MTSSAIGEFVIGVSPIGGSGSSTTVNGAQTILSQYANSPIILELIDRFVDYIDPTANIQSFYDLLWNVATAADYGLDVWGRIVGVDRVLPVIATDCFGFEEAGHTNANTFDFAPFYNGSTLTSNFALSDDAFRLLIFAKAAANIWDGSIPGLNAILRLLFPGQVCYVTDNNDMTITYSFEFTLNPVQLTVIANSGILPRPCGVATSIAQL